MHNRRKQSLVAKHSNSQKFKKNDKKCWKKNRDAEEGNISTKSQKNGRWVAKQRDGWLRIPGNG
jgi:hypothetical protein